MGRGNVVPPDCQGAKYFYIDHILYYGEEIDDISEYDQIEAQMNWEFFMNEIRYRLLERFDGLRKPTEDNEFRRFTGSLSAFKLAESSLVVIEMMDNGPMLDMISATIPRYVDDRHLGLATRHMYSYYEGVIEILEDMYGKEFLQGKLRLRDTAWTSVPMDLERAV